MIQNRWNEIHQKAIHVAKQFKKSETDLIAILEEVRKYKVYEKYECTNLFDYCTRCLSLSRDSSYTYIKIAEKSQQIPELKQAISRGKISVTNARRIAPVITKENKNIWIQKAGELSQRDLERELIQVAPRKVLPDKVRPVTQDTSEIRCAVPSECDEWIERAKDILSQKHKRPCNTGDVLFAAIKEFVEKHDPVRKAKRVLKEPDRASSKVVARRQGRRDHIPANTKHKLMLQHDGQCTYRDRNNNRCANKRWIHKHHITPVSLSGTSDLSNLTLLCSAHHRLLHQTDRKLF